MREWMLFSLEGLFGDGLALRAEGPLEPLPQFSRRFSHRRQQDGVGQGVVGIRGRSQALYFQRTDSLSDAAGRDVPDRPGRPGDCGKETGVADDDLGGQGQAVGAHDHCLDHRTGPCPLLPADDLNRCSIGPFTDAAAEKFPRLIQGQVLYGHLRVDDEGYRVGDEECRPECRRVFQPDESPAVGASVRRALPLTSSL